MMGFAGAETCRYSAAMTASMVDLAIATAPAGVRPALRTLFALDTRLAATVASTTELLIGQMRLAWWREALQALDQAPPRAEPLLRDLAALVRPHGVTGAQLAETVSGWEAVLTADPGDGEWLARHAADRGARMFEAGSQVLGANHHAAGLAGKGWALADLSQHLSDAALARLAERRARDSIASAFGGRWPRAVRPLGVLALLAASDLVPDRKRATSVGQAVSLLKFRLSGIA